MKARWIAVACLSLSAACQVTSNTSPQATVRAPELPPPPATATTDRPDALSYGTATRVKKGVTTQTEIMELFGGPSVMTTDKDGTEVWMYDKTTSSVSGSYANSGSQATKSEAAAMGAFFGFPAFSGVGGVGGGIGASSSQSAQVSQGTQNVERRVKTITFIIKFNADKTVKDYSVRQASY